MNVEDKYVAKVLSGMWTLCEWKQTPLELALSTNAGMSWQKVFHADNRDVFEVLLAARGLEIEKQSIAPGIINDIFEVHELGTQFKQEKVRNKR